MAENIFSKMKKREKIILAAAVIAVTMAFSDRLVLAPVTDNMGNLDEDITHAEAEVKKDVRILDEREFIEQEEKRYSAYVVQARSDEEEIAALLKIIENLASATSVYLIDLKPAGVAKEGLIKKFMVNVSCEAQMDQLVSFMHKVEDADVIMRIGAFTISPKSRQSSVARCDLLIYKIVIP